MLAFNFSIVISYETYFQAMNSQCVTLFLCTFCCILILLNNILLQDIQMRKDQCQGSNAPSEAQRHNVGTLT